MSANEIKTAAPAEESKPHSWLIKVHEFDFKLNRENANKILPFILYVSMWAAIYIANNHYGVKTIRKTDNIRKELKDLKADFYTINAELSNKSIQSEVAKMVEPMGLKPLTKPPHRVKVPKSER